MNNDNFLIEEIDLEQAKNACRHIKDKKVRSRAVANVLGAKLATKYFTESEVDTSSGLHNVTTVLSNIDISDVYVNNSYLDIRVYFNDNELCVPKEHFDRGILPVAYMFVKLEENLSGALVTGFILPSNVDKSSYCNGFYQINEDDLISYYDVEPLLVNEDEDTPDTIESDIFKYLDNNIEDIDSFYNTLLHSDYFRKKLIDAEKAKFVLEKSLNSNSNSLSNSDSLETSLEDNLDCEDNLELSLDINNNDDDELPMEFSDNIETFDTLDELSPVGDIDTIDCGLDSDNTDFGIDETISLVGGDATSPLEVSSTLDDTEISADIGELSLDNEDSISEQENEFEDSTITLGNFNPDEITFGEYKEENDIASQSTKDDFSDSGVEEKASTFEYSTTITPSLEAYEENNEDSTEDISDDEILESLIVNEQEDVQVGNLSEKEIDEDNDDIQDEANLNSDLNIDDVDDSFNAEKLFENQDNVDSTEEQLEELFADDNEEEDIDYLPKKKPNLLLPTIGLLVLIGAAGYFGYTKFVENNTLETDSIENVENVAQVQQPQTEKSVPQKNEAMPVETVENIKVQKQTNEGTPVSIPAIEKNLDASILISNLNVTWEVPSSYANSSTAKRYFTKLGKIIQLHLKSELLLLSKPPITNKIAVEIEFDKNNQKFKFKNIINSSGEKVVDNVIKNTVNNVLDMNLSFNMNAFANLSGNPVLIIKL